MLMHFQGLVSDLVDLGALQTGTYRLYPGPVELKALVDACVASVKPLAEARGLSVEGGVGRGLPRIIQADEKRLSRVLRVLAHNAVKVSPSGCVSVLASRGLGPGCRPGAAAFVGDWLDIRVTDTAPCLPDSADHRQLRGPFSCDGGLRRRLGLAAAARWCEAMDGGLWLECDGVSGHAFIIRLPLGLPSDPLEAEAGSYTPVMPSEA